MNAPDQPDQTAPAPPAEDAAAATKVDFLLAHAGVTVSAEERAYLIRTYTLIAPALAALYALPAARYAEPAFTYLADPARR